MSQRAGTAAATALGGLVLAASAPSPAAALHLLLLGEAGAPPTSSLVAAVALLAWGVAGWLTATVLVTASGHLPGIAGRLGAALSRRIAPTALRRTIELALGLTVAVGGLAAAPAAAAAGPAEAASATRATPNLDWAITPAPPDLDWATAAGEPPPAQTAAEEAVVVRPGDSLWGLAARQLRADGDPAPSQASVAQAWPHWWSANRDVVGDDPDLLLPGMRLLPPTAS